MGREAVLKTGWRVVYGPTEEAAARAHLAAAFENAGEDEVTLRGLRRIEVRKLAGGLAELIAPPLDEADKLA